MNGVIANVRAAYIEKDREMTDLRAELKEANERFISKNQEHLRTVEQFHMKIMLLESRQSPVSPGGSIHVKGGTWSGASAIAAISHDQLE